MALMCAPAVGAQTVDAQLAELRRAIDDLRTELADARREAADLRREVAALRTTDTPARSDEDQALVAAKLDELEQTKVAAGSKYRVRLSGLALFTASAIRGEVDNADAPTFVERGPSPSRGSLVGSVRQSWLRLDVFGPEVGGARTSGALTFDFAGGFPTSTEGLSSGIARLRTTTLAVEWPHTTIVAGQEAPFFSPLSPTSLVSSSYPALSSAGNLWTWIPQVHVDRHFTVGSNRLVLQGGVLDAFTGEPPANEYERIPTAGERSRVPAPAAHVTWQRGDDRNTVSAGAGAYYARQTWAGTDVESWAATGDWAFPVGRFVSLSGEIYRGRAIAGFGGGATPSVIPVPDAGAVLSRVAPVTSAGGWGQLKVAPLARLEFNAAIGTDRSTLPSWAQRFAIDAPGTSTIRRNSSGFVNGIYQLRSNLLFSLEYRRLQTLRINGERAPADHVTLGGGIAF